MKDWKFHIDLNTSVCILMVNWKGKWIESCSEWRPLVAGRIFLVCLLKMSVMDVKDSNEWNASVNRLIVDLLRWRDIIRYCPISSR